MFMLYILLLLGFFLLIECAEYFVEASFSFS